MLLLNSLMVLYCGDTSVAVMSNYNTQRSISTPFCVCLPRFAVWKRAWQSAVHQEVRRDCPRKRAGDIVHNLTCCAKQVGNKYLVYIISNVILIIFTGETTDKQLVMCFAY